MMPVALASHQHSCVRHSTIHFPKERQTRPTAPAPNAMAATASCPLTARNIAAPRQTTAMVKPSHCPLFVSCLEVLSAVVSHAMRRSCSFSAMGRMRSALPSSALSHSRYIVGGGRGSENDAASTTEIRTCSKSLSKISLGGRLNAGLGDSSPGSFWFYSILFSRIPPHCLVHVLADTCQILMTGVPRIPERTGWRIAIASAAYGLQHDGQKGAFPTKHAKQHPSRHSGSGPAWRTCGSIAHPPFLVPDTTQYRIPTRHEPHSAGE